jgi:hypothetical protein
MEELKPTPIQLQQSLSQLHQALVGMPRVDDASKRLLREVLADIERLLDPLDTESTSASASAQSLPRLEALAIEFEAEHPALAGGLREFIDLLGRAGL